MAFLTIKQRQFELTVHWVTFKVIHLLQAYPAAFNKISTGKASHWPSAIAEVLFYRSDALFRSPNQAESRHSRSHIFSFSDRELWLWPWPLKGQDESVWQISRSEVVQLESYFPDTRTHLADCSTWTTKATSRYCRKTTIMMRCMNPTYLLTTLLIYRR